MCTGKVYNTTRAQHHTLKRKSNKSYFWRPLAVPSKNELLCYAILILSDEQAGGHFFGADQLVTHGNEIIYCSTE